MVVVPLGPRARAFLRAGRELHVRPENRLDKVALGWGVQLPPEACAATVFNAHATEVKHGGLLNPPGVNYFAV